MQQNFKLFDASIIVDMSSSEIIRCKECGQVFDTIESLIEHEKSEKDQELQNKRLWSGMLILSSVLNSGLKKINI